MPEPLSRRVPANRLIEDQPAEPVPCEASAVPAGASEVCGQPSPALMARAERGWGMLDALHARVGKAEE
ncbi:hypothetical protein [Streptomyces sp. AB3(2024)]|uniref:hypothetical protein n=1 Tax=Streptomyces sp. AB3(2024) TaxID=3317321 RepID=UPI0035A2DFFD